MKLIIGCHVSYKKDNQLLGSVEEALKYAANTFMFYTGAPQNTSRLPIDEKLVLKAKQLMKENNINIDDVVIHAPYIINLANSNNFDFNIKFLKEEIKRAQTLGVNKLVLHPGSHVGQGVEKGIKNIIDSLNLCISESENVIICLETMAGKGTELGRNFDEIKMILEGVKSKDKIGVCMDTCHLNDAGYNLNDFDGILKEFDEKIGLKYLKVIHVNDSKNEIGSHKDRHENIGLGKIGFETLIKIIYNEKIKDIPKILETPYVKEYPPYKQEIEMIRDKKFNCNLLEDILK